LDVRPDKIIVKVRALNHWELQIETKSGKALQSTYRRSDVIEMLYDDSWFYGSVKLLKYISVSIKRSQSIFKPLPIKIYFC